MSERKPRRERRKRKKSERFHRVRRWFAEKDRVEKTQRLIEMGATVVTTGLAIWAARHGG